MLIALLYCVKGVISPKAAKYSHQTESCQFQMSDAACCGSGAVYLCIGVFVYLCICVFVYLCFLCLCILSVCVFCLFVYYLRVSRVQFQMSDVGGGAIPQLSDPAAIFIRFCQMQFSSDPQFPTSVQVRHGVLCQEVSGWSSRTDTELHNFGPN